MHKTALLVLILIAGCTTGAPRVTEGNDRTVTINTTYADDDISPLSVADTHCAKFGRKAQFRAKRGTDNVVYDCVL